MVDPETTQGSGDVKYHLGQVGKYVSRSGKEVEVELSANPSHLETVDPIVIGMARAKQDQINEPGSFSVMPLLIHGDSAFAGQGVVAETLQLGMIKGYRVGGTIHLIINNQLGFTTPPESARELGVLHRRGQDGAGADLPRERRRSRGVRAGRPARLRVPAAVPQGRRDRHDLLPAPRPQRGRRPELHPAADVQADQRPPLGPQALHRGAGQAGRHLRSRRPSTPSTTSSPGCRRRSRRPATTPRPSDVRGEVPAGARRRAAPGRAPASTGRSSTASTTSCQLTAGGLHHPSRSWLGSSRPARRCSARRARSTGRSARPSPSARCCSRAPTSGSPARTAAAAPSATATPCSSTTRPRPTGRRSPTSTPTRPSSGSTTRSSASTPPSASSTATPTPTSRRS